MAKVYHMDTLVCLRGVGPSRATFYTPVAMMPVGSGLGYGHAGAMTGTRVVPPGRLKRAARTESIGRTHFCFSRKGAE